MAAGDVRLQPREFLERIPAVPYNACDSGLNLEPSSCEARSEISNKIHGQLKAAGLELARCEELAKSGDIEGARTVQKRAEELLRAIGITHANVVDFRASFPGHFNEIQKLLDRIGSPKLVRAFVAIEDPRDSTGGTSLFFGGGLRLVVNAQTDRPSCPGYEASLRTYNGLEGELRSWANDRFQCNEPLGAHTPEPRIQTPVAEQHKPPEVLKQPEVADIEPALAEKDAGVNIPVPAPPKRRTERRKIAHKEAPPRPERHASRRSHKVSLPLPVIRHPEKKVVVEKPSAPKPRSPKPLTPLPPPPPEMTLARGGWMHNISSGEKGKPSLNFDPPSPSFFPPELPPHPFLAIADKTDDIAEIGGGSFRAFYDGAAELFTLRIHGCHVKFIEYPVCAADWTTAIHHLTNEKSGERVSQAADMHGYSSMTIKAKRGDSISGYATERETGMKSSNTLYFEITSDGKVRFVRNDMPEWNWQADSALKERLARLQEGMGLMPPGWKNFENFLDINVVHRRLIEMFRGIEQIGNVLKRMNGK